MLKRLVLERGMLCLCTIHQPSAKIFGLFDDLILLKSGHIAYQGTPADSMPFFERLGYPRNELDNPADHAMDVLSDIPMETLLNDIDAKAKKRQDSFSPGDEAGSLLKLNMDGVVWLFNSQSPL